MNVTDKCKSERCYRLPPDVYGALVTMIPPSLRFIDADRNEEHLLILHRGNRIAVLIADQESSDGATSE